AFGYVSALLLSLLTVTGHMVSVFKIPPFHYYALPLPLYKLFLIHFFGLVLHIHGLLFSAIRKSDGKRKKQLTAIFIGTSVGFIGGSTTFFPAYGFSMFPYGGYAVPVYILVISYGIFRYQIMDISV